MSAILEVLTFAATFVVAVILVLGGLIGLIGGMGIVDADSGWDILRSIGMFFMAGVFIKLLDTFATLLWQ